MPSEYLWHLVHLLAGLEQLQVGRSGACNNALLILLDPFVQRQNVFQVMWLGMHWGGLTRSEYLETAAAHSAEVEGNVNNGAQHCR